MVHARGVFLPCSCRVPVLSLTRWSHQVETTTCTQRPGCLSGSLPPAPPHPKLPSKASREREMAQGLAMGWVRPGRKWRVVRLWHRRMVRGRTRQGCRRSSACLRAPGPRHRGWPSGGRARGSGGSDGLSGGWYGGVCVRKSRQLLKPIWISWRCERARASEQMRGIARAQPLQCAVSSLSGGGWTTTVRV